MSDSLIIRLPANAEASFEWVSISAADSNISSPVTGDLEQLTNAAQGKTAIALAPAADVLRISAEIPLKGTAKIRQALPFALEEQLATDVEDQHFAFDKRNAAGRIPVAIVKHELLSDWLTSLNEAGTTTTAVYGITDAIPASPATITVLIENNQAVIQVPADEPTVVDEISLPVVLEMLLEKQERQLENDATVVPVNLLVYCDNATHERHQSLWERLRLKVENLDVKILQDSALPFLAGNILATKGVNLLQGTFARKSELPIQWQQWRIAALLLAGFLILNFAVKGAQLWQLNQADAALDAAAAEVLAQAFPDAAGAADPWSILRSRLGDSDPESGVSQAGFTEILEVLATGFAKTSGIKMDSFSFRNGELDLQLIAPDVSALDQLRQLISETGQFTAEIESANPDDKVIQGRMSITAKEPG